MTLSQNIKNEINYTHLQDATMTREEIARHAYMLTQYEQYGCITHDDILQYLTDEIIDTDELSISDYNDACYDDGNYDDVYYSMDELDEILQGQDVYWIACRVYYGNFNPSDDYFTFDGYGNLKSLHEWDVQNMLDENKRFIIEYLINNNLLENEDAQNILENEDAIINASLQLVEKGF